MHFYKRSNLKMTLGTQIRKHRKRLGLTLEQLSELSGVDVGTISALEKRESSRSKFARSISAALGMTVEQLEDENYSPQELNTGKSSTDLLPSSDTQKTLIGAESHENIAAGPNVRGRIPLISWVRAGMWSEAVDIYEPGFAERWLPFLKNNGEKTFALRVIGDSMTARFGKSYPDGCIIFVDPENRAPENGDRIVAKLEGTEEVTFKVFTKDAGRCWLRPLNDSHPPIYDAFSVVGKVIGKWEDD